MSTFYPIKSLEDILIKFRQELNMALQPIYARLDKIENELASIKGVEAQTGEHETGGTTQTDVDEVRLGYRGAIIRLRYLQIALRGYHSLLRELGLPKEIGVAIKRFEDLFMAIQRVIQMLYILRNLELGIGVLSTLGPFGYIIAGGMLASSIAYMGKISGGF